MLCTVQTLRKLVYRQSYKENSRKRETLFSIFELIKGVKKVHALAKILWNMSFYLLTQHLMDISSVKLLFERCLYWSRFTLFERRLSLIERCDSDFRWYIQHVLRKRSHLNTNLRNGIEFRCAVYDCCYASLIRLTVDLTLNTSLLSAPRKSCFCLCVSDCLSAGYLNKLLNNFDELWRGGIVTSNKWLDFGGDPDHDEDPGIFNRIFIVAGLIAIVRIFSDNWRSCWQILMKFLRVGRLTCKNQSF